MPLILPSLEPLVVYGELNTPPSGSQSYMVFDTFYDKNADTISGADLTALLALLGLEWIASPGYFQALQPVVIAASWEWDVAASPGSSDTLGGTFGDFLAGPRLAVDDPNTLGIVTPNKTVRLDAGDGFRWYQSCGGGGDTPLDYMAVALHRLV